MKSLMSLLLLTSLSASATFINPADIRADLRTEGVAQITEAEFNQRIAELSAMYAPIVNDHGGRLWLEGNWKNNKIVARANQFFNSWKIQFSGGLARRPELTGDGMSLIVCHEIGHHLGGFPFYAGSPLGGYWASVEGEADYYSTHVCARKLWRSQTEVNAAYRASADPVAKERCDQAYTSVDEQNLCYRITAASESVIKTMAALMNKPVPQFSTPDANVRTTTLESHPAIQCRMDTLFQGGLCVTEFDDRLIPGKKPTSARTTVSAEREAALQSCSALGSFTLGLRPACWFTARL